MSKIALSGNPSGTATYTIASPAGSTDRTLTLPDNAGTIVTDSAAQTLTNKTLGSGLVMGASTLTSGTAVASTSGTAIDFTGIPSWVKRITVMFSGVSLTTFNSEANSVLIQLGDAGGIESSAYVQGVCFVGTSSGALSRTDGFHFSLWNDTSATLSGAIQITNHSGNLWCASGSMFLSVGFIGTTAGSKSLSDTLDRVRITTVNGTDTFDAGTINIMWE